MVTINLSSHSPYKQYWQIFLINVPDISLSFLLAEYSFKIHTKYAELVKFFSYCTLFIRAIAAN